MDPRPGRGSLGEIDERLRELDAAMAALCARVTALETRTADAGTKTAVDSMATDESEPSALAPVPADGDSGSLRVLTLAGRTLIVLGGAFLLRALTDAGTVPPAGGILLGFAYASTWVGAADRAAIRKPASGFFHGLAGIVIGFPLLVEASARFGALSPAQTALLLAVLTTAILAVSWHRGMHALAAVASLAGSVTALTSAATTGQPAPFAVAAVAIGAVTSAVSRPRQWPLPAWPPAMAAGALVFAVIVRALAAGASAQMSTALVVSLVLAAVYLGLSLIGVAFVQSGPTAADITRSVIGFAIGVGGALVVAARMSPQVLMTLGVGLGVAGVAGYSIEALVSARLVATASAFLSSASFAGVTVAAFVLLSGDPRVLLFGALAGVLMQTGWVFNRTWLQLQGSIAAVICAAASGLLYFIVDAWTAGPAAAPAVTAVIAIGFTAYGSRHAIAPISIGARYLSNAVAFVHLFITVCGLTSLALVVIAAIDGAAATAPVLAAERSVVIAVTTVILAAVGVRQADAGLKWMAYVSLALGAVKLVVEDMVVSTSVASFVAFGAYGLALIAVSRILGRSPKSTREV